MKEYFAENETSQSGNKANIREVWGARAEAVVTRRAVAATADHHRQYRSVGDGAREDSVGRAAPERTVAAWTVAAAQSARLSLGALEPLLANALKYPTCHWL